MRDSVQINVKDSISVFVPNVFSPNTDGSNDELKVFPSFGVEKILYFSVYDRWGNQLFEVKDFAPQDFKSWDGTYRSVESEKGVYSYMVRVLKKNKKEQWFRGDVMLLR
jgi:gliding motility-associated-like protein